ncbi:MAG: hypothetical protein Kow00124_01100 [Anaerolineae bacterium]
MRRQGYGERHRGMHRPELFMTGARRFGKVMRYVMTTHEEDITCDECFEHVDRYVEMLRMGRKPDEVLLKVQRHLENCPCCQQEFQALLVILEHQAESGSISGE